MLLLHLLYIRLPLRLYSWTLGAPCYLSCLYSLLGVSFKPAKDGYSISFSAYFQYQYQHQPTFIQKLTQQHFQPQHFTDPLPFPDLGSLATHPSYRRLGAASRVIQWGIDQAEAQAKEQNLSKDDRHKIEGAYLESTPAGLSTYLKLGFERVGSVEHDLGDGREEYRHVCLMKRVG